MDDAADRIVSRLRWRATRASPRRHVMNKALNEGRGVRALVSSRVMRAIGSAALVTTMAAAVSAQIAPAGAATVRHDERSATQVLAHRTSPHVTCTDTWNGGAGLWSASGDWSAGTPQNGNDAVVCITAPGSDVEAAGQDLGVGELVLGASTGSPSTLSIISADGSGTALSVTSDSVIEPTGILDVASASDPSTSISEFGNGGSGATVTNDGTIKTSGFQADLYANLTNASSGTLSFDADETMINDNAQTVVNDGSLTVHTGVGLQLGGLAFTQSSGSIDDLGTIVQSGTSFDMAGGAETHNPIVFSGGVQFTDAGGTGTFLLEGLNAIDGTIPAGQTVTLESTTGIETGTSFGGAHVVNRGKLVLDVEASGSTNGISGSSLLNYGTFDIEAVGPGATFTAAVTNEVGGLLDATGPGIAVNNDLTNDGRLTLGAGTVITDSGYPIVEGHVATLGMTIGASDSSVTGSTGSTTFSLAGTLAISTTKALAKGTTVRPISSPSLVVSGRFTALSFPNAAYAVGYSATSVSLTAGTPFTSKGKAFKATKGRKATYTVATVAGVPAKTTLSASINWGDGSAASSGKLTIKGTTARVTGVHKFLKVGTFTVRVTIKDTNGTIRVVTESVKVG
jgi:hypothetical protein